MANPVRTERLCGSRGLLPFVKCSYATKFSFCNYIGKIMRDFNT